MAVRILDGSPQMRDEWGSMLYEAYQAQLDLLLTVDAEIWKQEAALVPAFYERFGDHLPKALWAELEALTERLANAKQDDAAMVAAE